MAQNITVAGASYSAVPSIEVPLTAGGTASFVDTSDATASASDIASGMTAYVNGSLITGTSSGGGVNVGTATATPSSTTATSVSFTGLSAEPTAFAVIIAANKSLSSGYYWVSAITYDGSTYRSTCTYYKSGGGGSRYIYAYSGYASSSYSSGTLTISTGGSYNSAGGSFTNVAYQLIYFY